MKESIIGEKSKNFAIKIIKLYKILSDTKHEYVLSKQILKSGTSIGANVREAQCGQSKADFYAKMYIAFKESAETGYWLELLHEADYISDSEFNELNSENQELFRILSSITKSRDNS